ncbi:protein of unknown function [Maridesulfovibrio hydrothermalis AM13 = DSM 14728]|uniref:Uncharacterized protein n=1 Tax=Maridesulfovibrio hydrothermalis AM13 = DSM 14728 TaxID=1121451 RepID=L0RC70_9BACT|nr:protein of unknown function [Maridesulfovibrio hydrothermalis AM13 = DSM 14728]
MINDFHMVHLPVILCGKLPLGLRYTKIRPERYKVQKLDG